MPILQRILHPAADGAPLNAPRAPNDGARAADVLFLAVLGLNALSTLISRSHWAGGILPVLAASLILPFHSGMALRRRLLGAFLCSFAGMLIHPLIPHAQAADGALRHWYPVLANPLAVALVLYALLRFHRSLFQDLAQRDSAQASAARSAMRYRQLIEASGQGVWMLDTEGRDLFVNERLNRMLGGLGNAQVLDLANPSGKREILRSLFQGGGRREAMEITLRRPGGGELRALLSLSLTLGMCLFSGLLAVRKVHSADPADLF